MNASSRFAFANHILTLLALAEDKPLTSASIARSVNTNPVVIRRLLANLREAGIVTSQPGTGGGWRLLRESDSINLCDIYRAVDNNPPFALHHRAPNADCPIGRNIQQALTGVFHQAELALEHKLADLTLADVVQAVQIATEAEQQNQTSGDA